MPATAPAGRRRGLPRYLLEVLTGSSFARERRDHVVIGIGLRHDFFMSTEIFCVRSTLPRVNLPSGEYHLLKRASAAVSTAGSAFWNVCLAMSNVPDGFV